MELNLYTWDNLKIFLSGFFFVIKLVWPLFLLIAIQIIFKIVLRIFEKNKLAKSGISDIDTMDGKTFEKYLEVMFEKLGYRVERTRYIGDYGADLVTLKDGVKTVIQAKRFKNKVNIKAIQEAVAAKGYYDCTKAMVVTNSYYTKQARELASANGVVLWNRDDLVKALLTLKKDNLLVIPQVINESAASTYSLNQNIQNNIILNECCICGKPVSTKVKEYCLSNKQQFGGKIYCYDHQKK